MYDATVERMAEITPSLKSVVVPGAGHQVAGDRPALFQQEVQEFLSGLG